MPRLARADRLLPTPLNLREHQAYDWLDLLPQYRDLLLTWDRVVYALPLLGEAPVCFYRRDRLERSHGARRFSEEARPPPDTPDDLGRVCGHCRVLSWPGLSFSASASPGDDDLDRLFFSVAACYARRAATPDERGSGEAGTNSPSTMICRRAARALDAPGFVHTLALLQRLASLSPPRYGSRTRGILP